MDLNIVCLRITVPQQLLSAVRPVVSGSGTLFEAALRQLCCTATDHLCQNCPSGDHCLLPGLTGRNLSQDHELLRRHQKPSVPYVFELPNPKQACLSLTLLGPACGYVALFVQALELLLGQQRVCQVVALDYQGHQVALDLQPEAVIENLPILSGAELVQQYTQQFTGCGGVDLKLVTPLRLVRDQHELSSLDPALFIRSLIRRVTALSAYYGLAADQDYVRFLVQQSSAVRLHSSACVDQSSINSFKKRGITGQYRLVGPFDELGPYLCLGSLLHVGKGAAYGMGAFHVRPFC